MVYKKKSLRNKRETEPVTITSSMMIEPETAVPVEGTIASTGRVRDVPVRRS